MKFNLFLFASALLLTSASCKIYFEETFSDGDNWTKRWVQSKHKSDYGEFKLTAGKFYGDADEGKGIQTSQDAHFYAISAKFKEDIKTTKNKTLVVQFSVKHEQFLDCGGGYLKVMRSGIDQTKLNGETPYYIMFGPDICGSNRKVHVIIGYKGKNYLIKKDVTAPSDQLTHMYTLIIKPDSSYKVLIDNKEEAAGKLTEDWDILPPKKIKDPKASKPSDWVDEEEIDDPEDTKPEGYDEIPEFIPDPEASKPEDWDDEMDGEYEAPVISNPDFKGEWKPRRIPNPKYKGEWVHPEIDNPEYYEDKDVYVYQSVGTIGLELWQVKTGTIFDNFLVTDSVESAKDHAKKHWEKYQEKEKMMKEKQDEDRRKDTEREMKKTEKEMKKPKFDKPIIDADDEFDSVDDHDEL